MTATQTHRTTDAPEPLVKESVLETQDLTVAYGAFTAADRITLRVEAGEIFGLLGPNGAGKTSVIRALTTILPVKSGSAVINGSPLTDKTAIRASIGVLPESNGYPNAQTAPGYLRFYGQLYGLPKREADKRATLLLRQMGLGGNNNRISTFSRGMRQRLGLARALMNRPAVLFLDEPTLGLDPAGKEDILAQLTKTALNEGTCVVLCSHLLDEVERVCDRVAIMNRAKIVAQGTVDEVIRTSGVTGFGRIRISPEDISKALKALDSSTLTAPDAQVSVAFDNSRPGDLTVPLGLANGASANTGLADTGLAEQRSVKRARSELIRTLIDAGIEVRSFDLDGARLSDAFLALTDSALTGGGVAQPGVAQPDEGSEQ